MRGAPWRKRSTAPWRSAREGDRSRVAQNCALEVEERPEACTQRVGALVIGAPWIMEQEEHCALKQEGSKAAPWKSTWKEERSAQRPATSERVP